MIAAQLNQTITIGDLYPDETPIKSQRVIGYKDSYIFSDDGVTWSVMGDRMIVDTSRAYKFDPAWYTLLAPATYQAQFVPVGEQLAISTSIMQSSLF